MSVELESELKMLVGHKAFQHILGEIELAPFQAVSAIKSLYSKGGLFIFDTGLGKTPTICAALKAIKNVRPMSKFLFFVKKSQLAQTPHDLRKWGKFRVVCSSAESEVMQNNLIKQSLDKVDVLMLTHETLGNFVVLYWLYNNLSLFTGIVVDEAHNLNNYHTSDRAWMLSCILSRMEYRFGLTATPIISDVQQFVNLLHMFWPQIFYDQKALVKAASSGVRLDEVYSLLVYNFTRSMLGIETNYIANPIWVEPHPWQVKVRTGDRLFEVMKGNGAENQVIALVDVVLERKRVGKRGLVYINEHMIREWVLPFLSRSGVKYECINGKVTDIAERKRIQDAFASGDLDIVITSVTESLNLDCEYIVFYEFTVNVQQMVGRGNRGLDAKVLEIIWILTKRSPEVQYFLDNIYARAVMVQTVLGKEYSEILEMGQMIQYDC
jgi:superfamily II DNA or RNA helicase